MLWCMVCMHWKNNIDSTDMVGNGSFIGTWSVSQSYCSLIGQKNMRLNKKNIDLHDFDYFLCLLIYTVIPLWECSFGSDCVMILFNWWKIISNSPIIFPHSSVFLLLHCTIFCAIYNYFSFFQYFDSYMILLVLQIHFICYLTYIFLVQLFNFV